MVPPHALPTLSAHAAVFPALSSCVPGALIPAIALTVPLLLAPVSGSLSLLLPHSLPLPLPVPSAAIAILAHVAPAKVLPHGTLPPPQRLVVALSLPVPLAPESALLLYLGFGGSQIGRPLLVAGIECEVKEERKTLGRGGGSAL
jgi:hypothetical protein